MLKTTHTKEMKTEPLTMDQCKLYRVFSPIWSINFVPFRLKGQASVFVKFVKLIQPLQGRRKDSPIKEIRYRLPMWETAQKKKNTLKA